MIDKLLEDSENNIVSHSQCCQYSCKNLVTVEDVPDWYSNNKYIYHGYRPAGMSIAKLCKSIFAIHNETLNIWTHIVGCIIFIGILCNFLIKDIHNYTSTIPICIFLVSTIICFTSSAIMHTVYPHSKHTCTIFCNLDYSGILILIYGGYLSFVHYEFFCFPTVQIFYYIFVTLLASLSTFLICNSTTIVRSLSFLLFGLTSLVPIIHKRLFVKESDVLLQHSNTQLLYIGFTLSISVCGILFYVCRIPERFHRDMFNIILSSHQIFHVCTIIAAYLYYTALIELYNFYSSHRCE